MLIAARDEGVKRFVLASSSAVYGDGEEEITPDSTIPSVACREDMPVAPMTPCTVSKWVGENYCRIFHDLYGLETVCLRYFNVFGPRQDHASEYAAVIPKFIDALKAILNVDTAPRFSEARKGDIRHSWA